MSFRSRSFNQIPISKVTVSTTSLIIIFFYLGIYVTKWYYSCLQFKAEICTRQECDWLKVNFITCICSINSMEQSNLNWNLKNPTQTEVHNLLNLLKKYALTKTGVRSCRKNDTARAAELLSSWTWLWSCEFSWLELLLRSSFVHGSGSSSGSCSFSHIYIFSCIAVPQVE